MSGNNKIINVNFAHERIADFMLMNPVMTQGEMAEALDYSEGWLSTIVNSDLFKEYYQKRRAELHGILNDKMGSKLVQTTLAALEKVDEVLGKSDVEDRVVVDVMDKLLRNNPSLHPVGNNNTLVLSTPTPINKGILAAAREAAAAKASEVVVSGEVVSGVPTNNEVTGHDLDP